MVLRPEPVAGALDALRRPTRPSILLDPGGEVFRQARARGAGRRAPTCPRLPALRGRRRTDPRRSSTWSSRSATTSSPGGELAALVVIDAVTRLLPGAIDEASTVEESFSAGPARVPAVHAAGRVPRRGRAGRPRERRPRGRPPLAPRRRGRADEGAPAGPAARRRAEPGRGTPGADRTSSWYASPPSAARRAPNRPSIGAVARRDLQGTTTVNVLDEIVADQIRSDLPELASGDTVKVSARVVEGGKERIQVFEGTVMRLRGRRDRPLDHGPQDRQRRRRRADVHGQQPAHREDRGRAPRPGRAAPSCTSCASASARPRRCASAEPGPSPHVGRPRPVGRRRDGPPAGYPEPADGGRASPPSASSATTGATAPMRVVGRRRGRRRPDVRRGRRCGGDHEAPRAAGSRASATPRPCPRPQRERLAPIIRRRAVAVGLGAASVREIDAINIYHATHLAMRRAVARLGGHDHVLVDGNRIAGFEAAGRAVHGDRRRRREVLHDRLRVGRGQGRPRPDDGPARGPLPGLRLGAQPGLRDPGASRRDPPPRASRRSTGAASSPCSGRSRATRSASTCSTRPSTSSSRPTSSASWIDSTACAHRLARRTSRYRIPTRRRGHRRGGGDRARGHRGACDADGSRTRTGKPPVSVRRRHSPRCARPPSAPATKPRRSSPPTSERRLAGARAADPRRAARRSICSRSDPGPPPALVVVEVRWRARRDFGLAEETVDGRKRARLHRAGFALRELGVLADGTALPALPLRFDLWSSSRAAGCATIATGPEALCQIAT